MQHCAAKKPTKGFYVNNIGRSLLLWGFVILLIVLLVQMLQGGGSSDANDYAYTDFLRQVDAGQVQEVRARGRELQVQLSDGKVITTYAPENANYVERLEQTGVRLEVEREGSGILPAILINALPILIIVGIWIFFMRQMQGGGRGGAMGFGKSRARMLTEKTGRKTFDDVAGIDEAKEELEEIVEFLRDPEKFQRLGGKIPKGCLLVGPPGTGKTLLARAIAGEANVPFFTISGSDFVEMFVGVGASRVRDMFEQAKKHAPCIVFIDEIDAVGRHRGAGLGGGNDEREQTLNQLLVEMDGFETNEGIILIAATNRPDVLDPALLRPGRFDRQVVVPNPDIVGREKILQVHLRTIPEARRGADIDARVIARGTPGFSGADLANLVNEAALLAARKGKRMVTMQDLEEAKDKVMMGSERRSMVMSEEEKKLTAYHEGGHALVALHCPASDPVHKATIIPRGRALGMVMRLPERDQYSVTREKLHDNLAIAMGGRVAEEIIFGHDKVTSGASSDISYATRTARAMVTQYGLSDELGPLEYGENQEEVFLGHSVTKSQNVSEETANKIDAVVRDFVESAHQRAKDILTENIDDLHAIANALLEYETLSGDEIKAVMRGEGVSRPDPNEPTNKPGGTVSAVPKAGKRRSSGGSAPPFGPEPQPEG
ncbi:MAG: ATP-dependent zinc metalloprotease FtsH [Pseudomonadota bacterium]